MRIGPALRRRRMAHAHDSEVGFGLVEVLVSSVILMVIVVSLSNLLVDSLSAAVLSQQREQAASLASDVVENAEALGVTVLSLVPAGLTQCTAAVVGAVLPQLTQATFQQCFATIVNATTFTVTPTITLPQTVTVPPGPVSVTVTVTWGTPQHIYLTSTQIGT